MDTNITSMNKVRFLVFQLLTWYLKPNIN